MNAIKYSLLWIGIILNSTVLLGQSRIFSGVIRNKTTLEPIGSVLVRIIDKDKSALSDSKGKFSINTTTDSLKVELTASGFNVIDTVILNSGYTEFFLRKSDLILASIKINGFAQSNPLASLAKVDLDMRPVKSSQELLKLVPGLFISQHQGGGKAEQLFLRGFDIDHGTDVQLTVDGIPVNMISHAHGQGYADLHFVIPEMVKNVDYGKGPYYAGQGNLNTAGYVSFKTFDVLDKNKIQVEYGQFNTKRLLGMANIMKRKNQNALIAGEYLYSDGPFLSPQHFKRLNAIAKYNLNVGKNTKIGFMGSAFRSEWSASGQVPLRAIRESLISRFGAIDNTEGGKTSRINISLFANSNLKNKSIIEQKIYYTRYDFVLFSNFTFFLNDTVNGDQIKQAEGRDIIGYNLRYEIKEEHKNYKTKFETGAGFRSDQTLNSELSHTKNRETVLKNLQLGNIRESNAFAFVNEQIEIKKWTIGLATRADYFYFHYLNKLVSLQLPDQKKAILSPKFSISYQAKRELQWYFKVGKGFHSNDCRVVVANKGSQILPSAVGADFGLIKKIRNRYLVQAAIWYLQLQQEFVYVGDEGIIEPSGRTRRYGLDVSARTDLGKGFFAFSDLNICNARLIDAPKGGNYIPLAPTFTSTGGINYQSKKGFYGSLRYRIMGNRAADENKLFIAKGYKIVDANLGYKTKHFEIGLMLENVFNTQWYEAQFLTESRLKNEAKSVSEIHITPGTPFFVKVKIGYFF